MRASHTTHKRIVDYLGRLTAVCAPQRDLEEQGIRAQKAW
jgi:hypothetical protein